MNLLEVVDFIYVLMMWSFGYIVFVVDVYVGVIVGWECLLIKDVVFVECVLCYGFLDLFRLFVWWSYLLL